MVRPAAVALVLAFLLLTVPDARAQRTGEIVGRVVDASGLALRGVTVTVSSPVLVRPIAVPSSETGTYRVPVLPIGEYTVTFELPGFRTLVRDGIRLEIDFTATIDATLVIARVAETVKVTEASPMIDLRTVTRGGRYGEEALRAVPTARDPWAVVEQTAGTLVDRQNVGGNGSGTQASFITRASLAAQNSYVLDGVDITDRAAMASPFYFDFDSFDEIQVATGAAGGAVVRLVTKSGGDRFKGSTRWLVSSDKVESNNVTDELRRAGATSGSPIKNIQDYGFEVGGPVRRGRAWFWGGAGRQDIRLGLLNFYQPTGECQAMKAALAANPLAYPSDQVRGCLNTDITKLDNYNLKLASAPFANNLFTFYMNVAGKDKPTRGGSDLRPLETTYRQHGVADPGLGSRWWTTGMPKTYRWTDRHVVNDRWTIEGSYGHVGNNFAMDFQDPSLAAVQAKYEVSSGLWARSTDQTLYLRPVSLVDLNTDYFAPSFLGGGHALNAHLSFRRDVSYTRSREGGDVIARYNSGSLAPFSTPYSARFIRQGLSDYLATGLALSFQDVYTRNRLTVTGGLTVARGTNRARAVAVPASPFEGQVNGAGVVFTFLPALDFRGAAVPQLAAVLTPRMGVTYDLRGNGRSVVKAAYARFAGQTSIDQLARAFNPVASTFVEFPWTDSNGDSFVQMNEVSFSRLIASGNYNANDPSSAVSFNRVDPRLRPASTHEVVATFEQELPRQLGIAVTGMWRRYDGVAAAYDFDPVSGRIMQPSDWTVQTFTPAGSDCPVAGSRCQQVSYYVPLFSIPTAYIVQNVPGFSRSYRGLEVAARKRLSAAWMLNASLTLSDSPVSIPSASASAGATSWGAAAWATDQTNIDLLNGSQYAPESALATGSVWVNARWVARVAGAYRLRWQDIGVGWFWNAHDGYPFLQSIQVTARPNRAGTVQVLLDQPGTVRLSAFQSLDLRFDKNIKVGRVTFQASADVFNVTNAGTVLARRRTQNATNGNVVSSVLGPRVVRFGLRASF